MLNDNELNQYATECATNIMFDAKQNTLTGDALQDYVHEQVHQYADGSEYVIYYSNAHELCQNCNTNNGEDFVNEAGLIEPITYDALACAIAYGELEARIMIAVQKLIEESE